MLDQRLQEVYGQLKEAIEEGSYVHDLLVSLKISRDDLLKVFTYAGIHKKYPNDVEYDVTLLAYCLSFNSRFSNPENVAGILDVAQEEGILKEVLTSASIRKKCPDGVKYNMTPFAYGMDFFNYKCILYEAKKKGILKEILTSVSIRKNSDSMKYPEFIIPFTYALDLNDWQKIAGSILDVAKKEGILKEVLISASAGTAPIIYALGFNDGGERVKFILGIAKKEGILKELLNSMVSVCYDELKHFLWRTGNHDPLNEIYKIEKSIATNRAIRVGSVCGVMAALAVGGGLFAAGVALPILAIIGIAVAAALVTGLVAGGITYTVLKPSEGPSKSLDNVDAEQKVSSGLVQQFS